MKSVFMLSIILIGVNIILKSQTTIIPLPADLKENGQSYSITSNTKILYKKGLKEQAVLLAEALSPATGLDFEITETTLKSSNGILLSIDTTISNNKDAYTLSVQNKSVVITGKTSSGVFYGIQSLLQLLPAEIYNNQRQKNIKWAIKGVFIKDQPTYQWRGMMLDVSRYFFSKEYVMKFIDMMAMYKMNVLHFHLIDDSGWRLEINKYPKLTSIGAWRGNGADRSGGYYTQADIKEIISYASKRNVDVVPEIELPAHALSAIVAYPHLSCTGEQYEVPTQHSISKEIYCVGKESTFDFLEDVFKETVEMFPSKYIHIGGDEANYSRWKTCKDCQKRKTELGLQTEAQLQTYFNNRVQTMLKKYGKTIVGWDEAIQDGLKDKMVGMIWNDPKKIFKAVEQGHSIVQSITTYTYFDMAEGKDIPGEVQTATWVGPVSLERAYSLDPMVDGLDDKYRNQILGASGTLWADQFIHGNKLQELIPLNENRSEKYLEYLAFPRMSALAEVCWTAASKKDFNDFLKRMSSHYPLLQQAGYGFRVPLPRLIGIIQKGNIHSITLQNLLDGAEIRYTTDGTFPNPYSTVYTEPVSTDKPEKFMAITVLNRQQYSLPLYFPTKNERFKNHGELLSEWDPSKVKSPQFNTFELNATGKINANGTYIMTFQYTNGESRLEINAVEVYKNGIKVAEDRHDGFTGHAKRDNEYKFEISSYETGASFTVKASVRGDISNDSNGAVFIKKVN